MNKHQKDLGLLFYDHAALIANDLKHRIRSARRERRFDGPKFCLDALRYEEDVIEQLNLVMRFFEKKLRWRRFTDIRIEYVQVDNIGQFNVVIQ